MSRPHRGEPWPDSPLRWITTNSVYDGDGDEGTVTLHIIAEFEDGTERILQKHPGLTQIDGLRPRISHSTRIPNDAS